MLMTLEQALNDTLLNKESSFSEMVSSDGFGDEMTIAMSRLLLLMLKSRLGELDKVSKKPPKVKLEMVPSPS